MKTRLTLLALAIAFTNLLGAQGSLTIYPIGPLPVRLPALVTITATDSVASEPGGEGNQGVVTFTRTGGDLAADLQVYYSVSGTASNGVDYATLPGTITIPGGQSSVDLVVDPLDDVLPESRETVYVAIAGYPGPVAGTQPSLFAGYIIDSPFQAVVYLADNDGGPTNGAPAVSLLSVTNGQVIASYPVTLLASASDSDGTVVSVEYFAGGESLGIVSNRPFIFPPISVPWLVAYGSTALVSDFINIFPVPYQPAGFSVYWIPSPGDYVLTAKATDNDGATTLSDPVHVTVVPLPIVTVDATDPMAAEPGAAKTTNRGVFTITRTGDTNNDLTVYYNLAGTAESGTDYEAPWLGAATIPAGQRSVQILINPLADHLAEPTESITLQLQFTPAFYVIPLNFPFYFFPQAFSYQLGSPAEATIYIQDADGGPRNRAPSVKLLSPRNGQSFGAGADIVISGEDWDRETYVNQIELFDGVNKIGEVAQFIVPPPPGTHLPFSYTWSNAPSGPHLLRARVTDTQGATQVSAPIKIRVK